MEEPFKIKNIAHLQLILASQSPRRKELLSKLGLDFKTQNVDVEEDFPASLQREEIVEFLAKKKADANPSSLSLQPTPSFGTKTNFLANPKTLLTQKQCYDNYRGIHTKFLQVLG